MTYTDKHRSLGAAAMAALLGMLLGCKPAASSEQARPPVAAPASDMASVMIDSVNYTHDREIQYALYDLSKPVTKKSAVGGAIVNPFASGGEKGCCLSLPVTWHPGMKVRVVWTEANRDHIFPEEHTRDLEIPSYDKVSDLYVIFYPQHEVEVVVSVAEPGHPDWRGRIKKTPWEQCLETYGRTPCKAALPKLFDTSAKGICTYFIQERRPQGEEKCAFLMNQCMQDYEDEPFCKGILWGGGTKNEHSIC